MWRLWVNWQSGIKLDKCPIPEIEDLFAKMSGGKTFMKLDMSQAYQQIILDEDSRKYVVINTSGNGILLNASAFACCVIFLQKIVYS